MYFETINFLSALSFSWTISILLAGLSPADLVCAQPRVGTPVSIIYTNRGADSRLGANQIRGRQAGQQYGNCPRKAQGGQKIDRLEVHGIDRIGSQEFLAGLRRVPERFAEDLRKAG